MSSLVSELARLVGKRFHFGMPKYLPSLIALNLSLATLNSLDAVAADSGHTLVYVGTYTGGKSQGIYAFRFDAATGAVAPLGLAAETKNPSFLDTDASGRFLYAVGELGEFRGAKTGVVSAFAIDRETGKLRLLNQASSGGEGPCHVVVDRTGRWVFVANYGGGSVAMLPVRADGHLGEPAAFFQHQGSSVNPQRQKEPHAHGVTLSPDQRFLFVPDLGLDRVMVYRFDAVVGTLAPAELPYAVVSSGAGPRHFAFHPNGQFAYAINELDSTVTGFAYNAERGSLSQIGSVSTLPRGFTGQSSTAEIQVHPSGKFLYGSNRGHDSIAVFSVTPRDGAIKAVECVPTGGKTPRNFAIDPSGRWLWAANQGSDNIVLFSIDSATGRLRPTGTMSEVGAPVCVRFIAP